MEHKKRRFRHAWSISETAFSLMTRKEIHKEDIIVLGRAGSDLLSQGLSNSTIGAEEFNGRVRDGIGFWLLAQATGPAKDIGKHMVFV